MSLRNAAVALVLFTACLAASPAKAEEGGFYASAGASAFLIDLPDYAPLIATAFTSSLRAHDGDADGSMGGLTLGWKTEDGCFIEARGFSASLDASQDAVFPEAGWVSLDWITGGFFTGTPVHSSTTLRVDQFGGELLAGRDIPVNENLRLSPYAGYFGMELDQHYSLSAYQIAFPVSNIQQYDRLNASYHGLTAGLRLQYGGEFLRARLDGSLGGALAQARYDGRQVASTFFPRDSAASDDHSEIAARARLEGGLDLLLGSWSLGLEGGLEYLSYVPKLSGSEFAKAACLASGDSLSGRLGLNLGYAF